MSFQLTLISSKSSLIKKRQMWLIKPSLAPRSLPISCVLFVHPQFTIHCHPPLAAIRPHKFFTLWDSLIFTANSVLKIMRVFLLLTPKLIPDLHASHLFMIWYFCPFILKTYSSSTLSFLIYSPAHPFLVSLPGFSYSLKLNSLKHLSSALSPYNQCLRDSFVLP